jgi:hypothetical protein
VKKKYQSKERKSIHKLEEVRGQELLVRVPLPMAEVWAEMQAKVEELAGQAGLQILGAILENEVARRVGPPHRPNPSAGCVRWGKQPGYVVFGGRKVPVERPRVRTREGQEVELESYRQLQQDGKLQRAVREGVVSGLSTRRCERRLEDLNLVVLLIAGIHFGGQVLVVALGIAEGGENRRSGRVAGGDGEHHGGQRALRRSHRSRTGSAAAVSGGNGRIQSTASRRGACFR